MYRINLNAINRMINIEMSGSMSLKEINDFIVDFDDLLRKIQPGQYSMLVRVQRLDPLSQDNLPVFQQIVELALYYANKVVIVNGNRTIIRMQLARLEYEARKKINSNTPILIFHAINEALNYLDGF